MSEHEDSDSPPRRSPPPQTWFPLAHPAPRYRASHSRLRLSSRLLLQIQQLSAPSSATRSSPPPARAIPILELYQPSRLGKSITDARKLHSHDMYLTQSEPYAHLPPPGTPSTPHSKNQPTPPKKSKAKSDHDPTDADYGGDDIVAVIYTAPSAKRRKDSPPPAQLYFPGSRTLWEASITPNGRYRFQQKRDKESDSQHQEDGSSAPVVVLEWERRPPRSPTGSRSSSTAGESPLIAFPGGRGGIDEDSEDRFVLGIADPPALRRPWLAQLTKKGVQVGGWDRWQRDQLRGVVDEGAGLYTWILTMGVWIARQEGWLQ